MLTYILSLHTGDRFLAGTWDTISIQLHGTEGKSQEVKVDGSNRGEVTTREIQSATSLGAIIAVEVHCKVLCIDDQWFCDKISVKIPTDETIQFPCYRWIGCSNNLTLRPASGTFAFQDTQPLAKELRKAQLVEAHKLFRWRMYAEGVPQIVDVDDPFSLPAEVQFSFTKLFDFGITYKTELCSLGLGDYKESTKQWESLCELEKIMKESFESSKTYDYVLKNWKEDKFFGYQFMNGLNPMVIQRCSKLPDNFPVTEGMVERSLLGSSLKHEMKKGNIFLCDYKMLDGLVGNVVHGRQQYLTAPLVLLYCNPHGSMTPIAIQLMQTPGADNPIFLPSDSKSDWLLAKIFVRAAEFSLHEVDFHLLRTHLLSEVFTMATLRNLPTMHPLFKILFPHIRYTLHINILARSKLISKDGILSKNSGMGEKTMADLLIRATAGLTYSSLCLPDNISERGLGNVPNYYYRDDGMRLWNIINKYVRGVLKHYYKSDDYVQKDTELQDWISDIFEKGFLGNDSTGIPTSFCTVESLEKFVTMVIFISSGQHASVNNGQFDFGAWMPNFPSALGKPPPKEKGQATEKTIMETLPDQGTTVAIMGTLKLLSRDSLDHYALGYFPEEWFVGEIPHKFMKHFKKDLEGLSHLIEERNTKLDLPYTYLDPKNIDNSIAI